MSLIAMVSLFANTLNFSGIFYVIGAVCNSSCYSLMKCTGVHQISPKFVHGYVKIFGVNFRKSTLHGHRLENLKLLAFPAGLESFSITSGAPLICLTKGRAFIAFIKRTTHSVGHCGPEVLPQRNSCNSYTTFLTGPSPSCRMSMTLKHVSAVLSLIRLHKTESDRNNHTAGRRQSDVVV